MNKEHLATGGVIIVLCAGLGALGWWVLTGKKDHAKQALPAPATLTKPLKEEQIHHVTLTPEAIKRLAVRTGPAEWKPIRPTRLYGGEVMVPAGESILVAAPLGGLLKAPVTGAPLPGQTVKTGQPIYYLWPLLSPESKVTLTAARVDAENQVESAQTQVKATDIALDRAKKLLQGDAGSKRMVDEAQAQFDLATKALDAAKARRDLLQKAAGDLERGTASPLTIEAPEDGILRTVSARPGQNVPAGAALFEVVNLRRVWVRVPVYVGDLGELDSGAPATVGDLTTRPTSAERSAPPAASPPSANPLTGTADRYYELDNRQRLGLTGWAPRYAPGERVAVRIPVRSDERSLTVPWSAVIHDLYGNTWVYEEVGERTYARRRIGVRFVTGATAILAADPRPFKPVVIAGAAELFGTETGFSK